MTSIQKLSFDEINKDPNIEKIKHRLISHFKPEKFYLFGSRAAGTNRADSDYDIALVINDLKNETRFECMQKAKKLLFDINISADVFVYSTDYFNDWKNELNSIPEAAHNLGVEIPLG